MQTDTKINWRFIAYNKKDQEIESFVIKDRTEHEAGNEAMHYVEAHQNITDWTLCLEDSAVCGDISDLTDYSKNYKPLN